MNTRAKDFNHIRQWLDPKLDELDLSVESFARQCDLTRTAIYAYRADKNRPSEQTMIRMCQVLGVSAEDGFAQYTPRKKGRPKMDEAKNDVDTAITLSSINPPTCDGRVLAWSGDGRVPEPGESIGVEMAQQGSIFHFEVGMVVGYFQAHGYLGVKVKLFTEGNKVVCVFGSEIDLSHDATNDVVI